MQKTKSQPNFPHVRGAIYSQPWAITSQWMETICEIAEAHIAGGLPAPVKIKRGRRCPGCTTGVMKISVIQSEGKRPVSQCTCPNCGCECEEDDLPPYDIVNGVAILPLIGPLFPKANLFTMLSGATSYEEFGNTFDEAMSDRNVSSVVIESDSPGGSCLRLSELCSRIYLAREVGTKPIFALIDPMAASAAYAIVSQCDEVYITESAMAGSIGTVMKYSNWDRAERNEGNDAVLLASSDVKSFGTPQSLAQYQSLIDTLLSYFEQFKDIVARGRQGIDIAAVSGAKVWVGKDAVKMKLADGVSSLENIIARLTEK
jgi:ClpP class serine protease